MFLRKYNYFLFLVFSIFCYAQPGKDGALTISTSKTVINRYTRVTTDILAGSNTVTVVDINDLNRDAIPYLPAGYTLNSSSFNSNALSKGDLIMLYQAQGALINTTNSINYGSVTNINGAGTYELAYVESVSGNNITLSCNSKLSYFVARYVQVIRIPQYTTLTIDSGASVVAIPWGDPSFGGADPSASERRRGGFNAVIADNIINNGSVNANQAGFRGGTRENNSAAAGATFNLDFFTTSASLSAEKGESIAGYRTDYDAIGGRYGRGAAANGGGGGNSHNAGGGGGANGGNVTNWFRGAGVMNYFGTCGTPGAWALDPNYIANGNALTTSEGGGHGGYSYGTNLLDACVLGPSYPADFIAPGVPAVTVLSSDWTGDNRDAVGGLGGRPVTSPNYQNQIFFGGGGGAGDGNNSSNSDGGDGGGIVFIVVTNSISGSGVIQANGENGFDTSNTHNDAPGGGGGGGTVLIQSNSITNTQTINANGGSGGNQLITFPENEGPGGGGGGGVLSINTITDSSTKTVAGGSNGTTTATSVTEFKANGATSGNSGSILSIAVNLNYSDCQLDLQTIKTVNNPTPLIGNSVVFTITITNNGPLDATGVIATDTVPSGYTVTAVSPSTGTWLAPNWTIGNLTNGQSATLNITATVNPTGIYTNTTTVTGTLKDSDLSNNTSSVCITPTTPTIDSTIATCSASGTSKINNYNPSNTYIFSPPTSGITIDGTGLISGLVLDTPYTVTAVNGNCTSTASISFTNQSELLTIPVLTSNSPICVGSSAIFTITGTAGHVVSYTGTSSGTATIGPLGVVSITIPNVTNAVTFNLTNISNGSCNRALTLTTTVTPQTPPNAGTNGTLTVCQGTTPTNAQLFAQLGGTPDAGGTWSNIANVYTYTVAATTPCTSNATATVTVNTQTLPIVGITSNTALSVGSTISLFPNTGGTWISSNSEIATVTNDGLVTGVAIGQVNFTFNSINGCRNTTESIIVSQSLLPKVSIADAVTVEGGNMVFSVELSKAYDYDIILTFDYLNGTTADSDYSKTITLLIPAGTNSATLTIASLEDSIDELDETFTLRISTCNILGIGISDTAIGTILNNDIDAINDIFMPIDGRKGGVTPSLLINDTIDLEPVVISEVNLTSLPLPAGLTLQSNGTIIVAPGTLAGTYPITYTICKVSSPHICDTAVSNVIVTETNIIANDDDFTSSGINGFVGGVIGNIFENNGKDKDIISQIQVSASTVTTTILNNGGLVGVTISPSGDLNIPAGTPAGIYTIDYRICEQGNLNNCDVAKISILVNEPIIEAMVDDYKTPINSAIGGEIKNIISNDLLNGQPVVSTNVNISLVNPSLNLYNFSIDNNGNFSIPEGLAKDNYRVEYQICEKLNPTNCTTSFVLFEVLDPCDFDDSPSSCDLIVHNAISPDDVNFNKIFIIEGIEKYPNNRVEIYNRWGVLVFQEEGYDNNQKSFNGFSEGRSTIKQTEKLPGGTYYYTLQYVKNNGLTKKIAGFLFIER